MATAGPHARYPGAQPFADDEASRRVFFGREPLVSQLINQILANRLLVIYAKSGQGKTSLLRAGVAPRLREAGYLPLHVRVNDTQRGPLQSLFEGVLNEAQRQGIEHTTGAPTTLWSFFKTLELWRQDLLLTPVLILDQFEELFTLQKEAQRRAFLDQLGYLVRGVCPPGEEQAHASPRAPALRVVLSLREDCLGLLEEAATHIPQILDHRFRLAPLTLEAAQQAMIGPATVEHPSFASPPFEYEPDALELITSYLSRRKLRGVAQRAGYVEPFQLQLVCQSVERLVSSRPQQARHSVSARDVGGRAGLERTLQGFYRDTLRALPRRTERSRVAQLCQRHLISVNGRRLSLEEAEIQRRLGISRELLRSLVQSRLLRTETRAASTYYELSHDALIEPLLAPQRRGALLTGWLQVTLAGVTCIVLLLFSVKGLSMTWTDWPDATWQWRVSRIATVGILLLGARVALSPFGKGLSRVRRFTHQSDTGPPGSRLLDRAARQRGVWLIWAALLPLPFAFFHAYFFAAKPLYAAFTAGDSVSAVQRALWQIVISADILAWLIFDLLLLPAIVGSWCAEGLRRLQGYGPRRRNEDSVLEPLEGRHVLLAAVAILAAVPPLVQLLIEWDCRRSEAGRSGTALPRWLESLGYGCWSPPSGPYPLYWSTQWSALFVLLATAIYFLRRRPASAGLPTT